MHLLFFVLDTISCSDVKVFKHQHVTLISLNRPDNKNRLNVETVNELNKVILNFENDNSSTIAVLYGEGGSFCAGFESDMLTKMPQIYNVPKNYFFLCPVINMHHLFDIRAFYNHIVKNQ